MIDEKSNNNPPIWLRIIGVMISFIIVAGIFQFFGMLIADVSMTDAKALQEMNVYQFLVMQGATFFALIIVVGFYRIKVDKRSFESLGLSLKGKLNDLIAGLAIAFLIIGGGTAILSFIGSVDLAFGQFDAKTISLSFLLFIIASLNEEILIRGYVLNNLLVSMNKYVALLISAMIFALIHIFNFDISLIGFVNLFLAGVLLGASYIFTKNLWLAISLHTFWNFIQGPVFGYSVSGQKMESVFNLEMIGDQAINGGEFGFEGSLVCSLLTVVAIALIILFFKKKGNEFTSVEVIESSSMDESRPPNSEVNLVLD